MGASIQGKIRGDNAGKGLIPAGGSSQQGCNLAGESPVVSVARVGHVAIPQFMVGNPMSIAWCKRPAAALELLSYSGGCNLGA